MATVVNSSQLAAIRMVRAFGSTRTFSTFFGSMRFPGRTSYGASNARKLIVRAARMEAKKLELATRPPEFELLEPLTGNSWTLSDFEGYPALLVMFICNHCPFVIHLKPEIVRLTNDYITRKGLGVIAISSNSVKTHPQDGPEAMAAEAQRYGYQFPYVYDETQEVAKEFGAVCTPDFFVFKKDGRRPFELSYHGQFDDSRPGNGRPVTGRDLRNALDCVLSGRPVSSFQNPRWEVPSPPCTSTSDVMAFQVMAKLKLVKVEAKYVNVYSKPIFDGDPLSLSSTPEGPLGKPNCYMFTFPSEVQDLENEDTVHWGVYYTPNVARDDQVTLFYTSKLDGSPYQRYVITENRNSVKIKRGRIQNWRSMDHRRVPVGAMPPKPACPSRSPLSYLARKSHFHPALSCECFRRTPEDPNSWEKKKEAKVAMKAKEQLRKQQQKEAKRHTNLKKDGLKDGGGKKPKVKQNVKKSNQR